MKTYNQYINESIRDKMTGKSDKLEEWKTTFDYLIEQLKNQFNVNVTFFDDGLEYVIFIYKWVELDELVDWFKDNTDFIISGHKQLSDNKTMITIKLSKNIHESIRDKMTPKSEEDIMNYLEELTQEELDLLFVKSVCGQQIPMIKATLRMGANPNSKDPHGLTALYRAVQGSITTTPNLEVIKLLLDNGAGPMLASKRGFIPLRHAETWGKPEIVELLKKYVKTNESIRDKMTPKSEVEIKSKLGYLEPNQKLFKGAKEGLLWLVKQALEEGADINKKTIEQFHVPSNALKIAVEYKNDDIVEFLLTKGIVIQPHLLDTSLRNDDYDTTKLLLDAGVTPTAHDLILGIETNDLNIVKILLDKGVDVKDNYKWAMQVAEEGTPNYEIMNLLQSRIKTNESIRDKMTPKSDIDIRKYIKELPAKKVLSFNREYGLELSDSEIKELVKKLSPKDVLTSPKEFGIKLSDEDKINAMKKLKVGDYNELVHDEMRFGGIKHTTNRRNPAEWTVIEKRLKELKLPYDTAEEILNMREDQQLKELGYDIDNMIPLAKFYTGIRYGFLWLIQQGLDSGEVNIDSLNGHALDVAVTNGDVEMVELLLKNGASVDKRDYLHINQQKHKNKKIEELLNKYGL